jgi:D-alanyl-D-alanine carboxypeptidase
MTSLETYKERIRLSHESLKIPNDYELSYGLPLHMEANSLVSIENDVFDRPQKLIYSAGKKWSQMKEAANFDGINIKIVSAFRSVNYQVEIITKKLNNGEKINNILGFIAAPGYSEHHTGRALDLTTDNCKHLSEFFEKTEAFAWLTENASRFSFRLSYPRNCKEKISYEPWHWVYNGSNT